jgi:hypothetical protein
VLIILAGFQEEARCLLRQSVRFPIRQEPTFELLTNFFGADLESIIVLNQIGIRSQFDASHADSMLSFSSVNQHHSACTLDRATLGSLVLDIPYTGW